MKRTWTEEELLEHFTLLPGEFTAVSNKSTQHRGTRKIGHRENEQKQYNIGVPTFLPVKIPFKQKKN